MCWTFVCGRSESKISAIVDDPSLGEDFADDTGMIPSEEDQEEPVEEDTAEDTDPAKEEDTTKPPKDETLDEDTTTKTQEEEETQTEPYEEPPVDDCETTSDLIYVIDRYDEALYLFDPQTMSFDFIGELDCGLFSGTPASMSVSRDGIAYVRYSSNTVYAVDLATMNCVETAYASNFGAFGMGYATDTANTWQDQLYIANQQQLATLEPGTWTVSVIGYLPSQSELTGNASGELWAVLPLESPAKLVQLDKNTGQTLVTLNLYGFPDPMGIDTFAFATWGDDFWIFVRNYGMGNSTDVYRVTSNGSLTLVSEDTGMDVVGAGVSTCAPTQ